MTGFVKCTPSELREVRKKRKLKKPQIVWVERRKYFKPPDDTLEKYLDFMRRYEGRTRQIQYALEGSKYDSRYRHKVLNHPKAISRMKAISARSKRETVYLITSSGRPDADIIISLCVEMIGKGVW